MGITQIDPIPYKLYFERFLNKSRVEAYHTYTLQMEDGSELVLHDYDKIPLVGGREIEVNSEVDWDNIDIDVDKIVK